jgi:hypothetical protein
VAFNAADDLFGDNWAETLGIHFRGGRFNAFGAPASLLQLSAIPSVRGAAPFDTSALSLPRGSANARNGAAPTISQSSSRFRKIVAKSQRRERAADLSTMSISARPY